MYLFERKAPSPPPARQPLTAVGLGCEDFVIDSKLFGHLRTYSVKVLLTFHGNIYACLFRKSNNELITQSLMRTGIEHDNLNIHGTWDRYVDWYREQIKLL